MSTWRALPAVALALATSLASAQAAPLTSSPAVAKADTGMATQVDWRWRRGCCWGRGGVGLGIGAGIIAGAIIADQAYRPRRGYYYDDYAYDGPYYYPSQYSGDPRVVCAENFRSFEWRTGLYTTYSGEKRLCPYLR